MVNQKGGTMFKQILVILVVIMAANLCWAGDYAGFELYPTSSTIFFFAGKDLTNHFKADLWAAPGYEIGLTIGPKIGPFNLGLGTSMGEAEGLKSLKSLKIIYLNADLGFGFDFGNFHWQSYNLYQKGLNDMDNFILSRHWLSLNNFPFGLIGHNIRIGNEKPQLFWGYYCQLGKMSIFASNKICFAIDLWKTNSFWSAWVVDF